MVSPVSLVCLPHQCIQVGDVREAVDLHVQPDQIDQFVEVRNGADLVLAAPELHQRGAVLHALQGADAVAPDVDLLEL